MSYPNFESAEQHGWESAVDEFVDVADVSLRRGIVKPEEVVMATGQLVVELSRAGMLDDLGNLQGYLRQRRAPIQLVAQPFRAEDMPVPGMECVDVITGQPRAHWMQVSLGYNGDETEAQTQLRALARSDDVNETALRHDTGILKVDPSFFPGDESWYVQKRT